jgi:hypothetical protein
MNKCLRCPVLIFLLAFMALAHSLPAKALAFPIGEKIEFKIGWGLVTAGSSSLEIADTTRVDGFNCFKILSRARSRGMLGAVYPVKDRITSYMDVHGFFSRGIHKKMREGTYRKDREFIFSPEKKEATRIDKGKEPVTRKLLGQVQDVLSAFYWVRLQELEVGQIYEVTAFDNFKTYPMAVKVLDREWVTVPAGRFDCFKVQPLILSEGLFKASGDVFIWLTADARHLPVKMKSRILIGSISACMTSWEPGAPLEP